MKNIKSKIENCNFKGLIIKFVIISIVASAVCIGILGVNFAPRMSVIGDTLIQIEKSDDYNDLEGYNHYGDFEGNRHFEGEHKAEQYDNGIHYANKDNDIEDIIKSKLNLSLKDMALLLFTGIIAGLIALAYYIIVIAGTLKLAWYYGVNPVIWGLVAVFINIGAPIILWLLGCVLERCPECGKIVTRKEKHCVRCGKSLVKKCENCGEEVKVSQKYCGNCGSKVD